MIWKTNIKNKLKDTLNVTTNGNYDLTKHKSVNVTIPTEMYKFILGTLTSYTPENSVTRVGNLNYSPNLTAFTSNNVKNISRNAFRSCRALSSVTLNEGLNSIGNNAFEGCTSLTQITIPSSVTSLVWRAFQNCSNLVTANLYNLTNSAQARDNIFNGCNNLEFVTLGNGFNWSGLELQSSTKYSHDTILGWFNALYDRSALTTYKLYIGNTNIAKMSVDEIAIATAKNWTIA